MIRRRLLVAAASALLPALFIVGFGHRGVHMARSLLIPGAGLYDERLLLGLALSALGAMATIAWLRWGVDWAMAVVLLVSVVVSGVAGQAGHGSPLAARAAHEFPLVVLVLGAIGWARSMVRRLPLVQRVAARRPATRMPTPVERCRAAAIAALAGADLTDHIVAIEAGDVAARARRIGFVARMRRGVDPFKIDHAHARAAFMLCRRMGPIGVANFRRDAARAYAGVPCSEPGWVRLLDGTLAALATGEHERWVQMLDTSFRLHRGHRPAWMWTPLGIAAGRADEWEHAAATALARHAGWTGDDDWIALRQAAFGAAARGTAQRADERLIAAGRIWAALVGDTAAARILARPTIRHDRIALALDAYAKTLITEGIAA